MQTARPRQSGGGTEVDVAGRMRARQRRRDSRRPRMGFGIARDSSCWLMTPMTWILRERLETWWHEFGDDDADGEEASEGAADYVLDGGLRVHGLSRHGSTGARLLREFIAPRAF